MRISIGVPTYNPTEDDLRRCLDSVLRQWLPRGCDWDISVCDDSSDSIAGDVVRSYSDPRIRYEKNIHRLGMTVNWSKALGECEGDVVALLHQDDWLEQGCLRSVVEEFGRDQGLVLLGFGQRVHLDDDRPAKIVPRHEIGCFTGEQYVAKQLMREDCPAPSETYFRRSAMKQVNESYRSELKYCPELDLYIRLGIANGKGTFRHSGMALVNRYGGDARYSGDAFGLRIRDVSWIMLRHRESITSRAQVIASLRSIARDFRRLAAGGRLARALQLLLLSNTTLSWLFVSVVYYFRFSSKGAAIK